MYIFLFPLDLKMTTQRRKKMRMKMMMRRRTHMMGRSPSQSWSLGVADAWSEMPVFVSSQGETAVRKRMKLRRMRMRKEIMTCMGRTVTQTALYFIKKKTRMKMKRMNRHPVRLTCD